MRSHLTNHRARVAHPRSDVIPAGDGLPSTHAAHTAAPGQKVTTVAARHAPHSFAATPPLRRTALIPWWSLLLSALALATLGAVTAWTELPPVIGAMSAVAMAGCCLVLVVAELVHRVSEVRR